MISLYLLVLTVTAVTFGHEHHYAPAHYKFDYGVHDPHTHDVKSQWEHRDGKEVKGAYTLKEADGTTRLVEYTAGPHSGFNAVVKRIGHAHHPAHYGHHHGGHGGDSFVPSHYKFSYGVHDPHTHDMKSHWEERDGHHVKGAYTLKEADGTIRIVEYTVGPHSGFQAVVKRIGHANHPAHDHHKNGQGGHSFVGPTHWGFQHG
ncbi:hypothetical protein WA026_014480 [Henosepilachna vigintioctopunctata]|uniref:Uncharacterized protein n=1 Tax=Henosepilachna vigintioctopunctata TaxID=420089 RepID=A0AAW1UNV2_9CUCU